MTWTTLINKIWNLIDKNTRGNIYWPKIRSEIANLIVKTDLPLEEKKLAIAVISGRLQKIQSDIASLKIV